MFFKKENKQPDEFEAKFVECKGKPPMVEVDEHALNAEAMIQNAVMSGGGFMVFTFKEEGKTLSHSMIGSGFTNQQLCKSLLVMLEQQPEILVELTKQMKERRTKK